ncbi:DUF1330 domain-containing protein [Vibrio profundum]|uniref:DUF1330 domain-containing protein n=1 Tax=Vibrio profundum TaxID=2910247 RepID=UPI003D1070F7
MSAYMIGTIKVKQPEKLQEYFKKVQKLAMPYGAEPIVMGKAQYVITGGDCDHELNVVLRFPSMENLQSVFESDEYKTLIPLREEGAEIKMTAYQMENLVQPQP